MRRTKPPRTKVGCDYCKRRALYIALTVEKKWEVLCERHFTSHAYGFGKGYGYRLSNIPEELKETLEQKIIPLEVFQIKTP